ncbi:LytR C-terminal domain-containing protein [Nesterenkonia aerolata]|uniref:LytR C-terminal domain-containing protein n=1 Tax=Nesterenkonia aerolata TaxID=3074079 RepID=A0ABU2DSX6_9MICC|nr:LytR C-terminal domain-containing protein [Nesterenkonia sp. LY-0111]MDR8019612.1 LytR C-terminal domain-containing protein [Nesterenkonia sp. LY-0111]
MTKYPQDEFDDVAPYPPGQAGSHRAPTEAPGAKRTGLPWIVMLAVLALAVGVVSYVVLPQLGDGDEASAEEETAQAEEGDDGEDGESEEEATEEETESQEEESEESPSAEESPTEDEEDSAASDTEAPVQVLSYQAPADVAQNAQSQLEGYGYNVVNVTEWTYAQTSTPAVFYPPGQGELAQEIASNMGIDNVVEDARWSSIAVVVDSGYAG